jgi:hypothetical protein
MCCLKELRKIAIKPHDRTACVFVEIRIERIQKMKSRKLPSRQFTRCLNPENDISKTFQIMKLNTINYIYTYSKCHEIYPICMKARKRRVDSKRRESYLCCSSVSCSHHNGQPTDWLIPSNAATSKTPGHAPYASPTAWLCFHNVTCDKFTNINKNVTERQWRKSADRSSRPFLHIVRQLNPLSRKTSLYR